MRSKVRQLTGRKSPVQLTDAEIDFQLNNFYTLFFPLHLRTLQLRQEFSFTTQPNIDVYPQSPNTFQSFEPTAYVAGYQTILVEDRTLFHKLFPDIRQNILLTSGTGLTGPYTGTATGLPILKGSVLVSANISFDVSENLVDDSVGNLRDSLPSGTIRGTVNYETGAVSVTFSNVVPSGNEIRMQHYGYNANRPTTVFYFDNQLILRPVPDQAYDVRLIAYLLPTALITTNPNSLPDLNEYWESLCYGASSKIFENNRDTEGSAEMKALLEESLILLGRREWHVLHSQRTPSIYDSPHLPVFNNQGFFWSNS